MFVIFSKVQDSRTYQPAISVSGGCSPWPKDTNHLALNYGNVVPHTSRKPIRSHPGHLLCYVAGYIHSLLFGEQVIAVAASCMRQMERRSDNADELMLDPRNIY
ncbi:hypothetical protein GWI33_014010 [Rhynchophorus ferrugineus]|uniref:Uncharacterized protein n=1 Tax=Rhynchophorus ferrugineus TaxID=354439 RepID=A0A834I5Y2_RHYFE|nr:hypothetical protein GWI33_014010 [Rhynchophorus ferrugineus]